MIDRKLKKELNKWEVPAYDAGELEDTLSIAKNINLHPERQRMTGAAFFFGQLRFIRKRTWVLKLAFSAGMLWLLGTGRLELSNWLWTVLAISGPVLCLQNANELCRLFQPGLLEIQMTARNSFRSVLLIRLTVFGILDFLFFVCAAVFLSAFPETALWQAVLYGMVPYEIMCLGCLFILNRCGEETMLLYTAAWGVFLSCALLTLKISGAGIFEPSGFGGWALAGAAALPALGFELKRLLKNAGGNRYAFNDGTFIETV
ncbi:MAG: hypothetical protein Q4F41_13095 [Eubacteriales bacterium]|nr:hypothetical protein [Eubacteriales bacterium]